MADLYECSNSANIIRRNYQDNAPKWRYPDGLDVAIFSVQKAIVAQHYPEAIEADGNVKENMPIKIGDRLAVFIYDEYYKKTRATEVEILVTLMVTEMKVLGLTFSLKVHMLLKLIVHMMEKETIGE
jgi:hypothetical protein